MTRAWLLACGLSGCADHTEAALVESAHVRLHHPADGGDCPSEIDGALAFLESATQAIADYLAVPAAHIDYHWRSAQRWPEGTPCAAHALGCTDDRGRVYAKVLSPHELVHATVVQRFGSFRVSFLDEGLAEALGGTWGDAPIAVTTPLDELLAADRLEADDYGAAGRYVSYLLAAHGADRFVRLLERAPRGTLVAALRASFADIYGMTPEAVLAELGASGWELDALGVAYCAAPALASEGGIVRASGSPSCSWPVGAASLEVPDSALHRIDWRASSQAAFHLRWCPLSGDGPPFEFFGASAHSRSTEVAQLRRGRYLLALSGEPGVPGDFDLRQAEGDCHRPMALSPEHEQLRVKPGAGETKTVYFRAARAAARARLRGEVTLELCAACDRQPCASLADGAPVALTPGSTHTLRVAAAAWGDEAGLDFE